MKRLIILVIVIAIVGIGYCSTQIEHKPAMAKQNKPETVVRAAILAMETGDVELVQRYFTPLPGRNMAANLQQLFTRFDTIVVEGISVEIISHDDVAARCRAIYTLNLTRNGIMDNQRCNKVIKLIYSDDKWWINEAF